MVQDVLVPRVEDIREIDMSDVKWVLILEKEVGGWDFIPTSHERRTDVPIRLSTADSHEAVITLGLPREKGSSSQ